MSLAKVTVITPASRGKCEYEYKVRDAIYYSLPNTDPWGTPVFSSKKNVVNEDWTNELGDTDEVLRNEEDECDPCAEVGGDTNHVCWSVEELENLKVKESEKYKFLFH